MGKPRNLKLTGKAKPYRCVRCGNPVDAEGPCSQCDTGVRPFKGIFGPARVVGPGELEVTPAHAQEGTQEPRQGPLDAAPATQCGSSAERREGGNPCQFGHTALASCKDGGLALNWEDIECSVTAEKYGYVRVHVKIAEPFTPSGYPFSTTFSLASDAAEFLGVALQEAAVKSRETA